MTPLAPRESSPSAALAPDSEETVLDAALDRLAADGLVAFPTETVWGLAARATSAAAVARLRAWKGRAEDHPLSLLAAGRAVVERFCGDLDSPGSELARRFWPGPLTLVLPALPERAAELAGGIAAAHGGIGWRVSSHPMASALARGADARGLGPLTATSLNASGEPPARRRDEALALCGGPDAPHVLAGPRAESCGKAPSTVLEIGPDGVHLLREGAIPRADLATWLPSSEETPSR